MDFFQYYVWKSLNISQMVTIFLLTNANTFFKPFSFSVATLYIVMYNIRTTIICTTDRQRIYVFP